MTRHISTYNDEPPPADGPVHFRWTNARFWSWIAERITWLDDEARRFKERKEAGLTG